MCRKEADSGVENNVEIEEENLKCKISISKAQKELEHEGGVLEEEAGG